MLAVCGTQMCEAVQITMIFPMLVELISDLKIAKEPSDVGFYSGILGATFCTGQVMTAAMWGRLSDIYGRRYGRRHVNLPSLSPLSLTVARGTCNGMIGTY